MTRRLRNWLIAIASGALLAGLAIAYLAYRLGAKDRTYDSTITTPSSWDDVGRHRPHGARR